MSVQNFVGTNTLPFVLVGAILLLLVLLPTVKRLGDAAGLGPARRHLRGSGEGNVRTAGPQAERSRWGPRPSRAGAGLLPGRRRRS